MDQSSGLNIIYNNLTRKFHQQNTFLYFCIKFISCIKKQESRCLQLIQNGQSSDIFTCILQEQQKQTFLCIFAYHHIVFIILLAFISFFGMHLTPLTLLKGQQRIQLIEVSITQSHISGRQEAYTHTRLAVLARYIKISFKQGSFNTGAVKLGKLYILCSTTWTSIAWFPVGQIQSLLS